MNQQKTYLADAAILRPLAIVLLVMYHAFIPWIGGWKMPEGCESQEVYWWIAKTSYAFMLELFVMISGYVFGLQLEKKAPGWADVVKSKLKRLILPSIVFSILYYVLFFQLKGINPIKAAIEILSGTAHMWFLPMLFWATLAGYCADRVKLPTWLKLAGIWMLPALTVLPVPLGIGVSMYYIPFFYTGMLIYRQRQTIDFGSRKSILITVLLGVFAACAFVGMTILMRDYLDPQAESSSSRVMKAAWLVLHQYARISYALPAVGFVYMLTNLLLKKGSIRAGKFITEIGKYCFGIYLLQQFVLKGLYYYTPMPQWLGQWLPWAGFGIALIASALVSWMMKKTKVGNALI